MTSLASRSNIERAPGNTLKVSFMLPHLTASDSEIQPLCSGSEWVLASRE